MHSLRIALPWSLAFSLGSCAAAESRAPSEPVSVALTSAAPPGTAPIEAEPPAYPDLPMVPEHLPCYVSYTSIASTTVHVHAVDLSDEERARLDGREAVDDDAIPARFAPGREFTVVGTGGITNARISEFYMAEPDIRMVREPWVKIEVAEPVAGLVLIFDGEHPPPSLDIREIEELTAPDAAYRQAEAEVMERLEIEVDARIGGNDFFMHRAVLPEGEVLLAHGELIVSLPDFDDPDDEDEDGGHASEWAVWESYRRSAVVDEQGHVLRWVDIMSNHDCIHETSPMLSYTVDLDHDDLDEWIGLEQCEGLWRAVWVRQTAGEWATTNLGFIP